MAIVTRVHGKFEKGQFVGRELHFFTVNGGSAITANEAYAIGNALGLFGTIEVIGEFTPGVSTEFNVIMSGVAASNYAAISAAVAAVKTGASVATMAF